MTGATPGREEDGFTLIEVVVATLIFLIVATMLFQTLIDTSRTTSRAESSTQAENTGRTAMRTVTEDIRSAVQIRQPTSGEAACPSGLTYPSGFGYCVSFLILHEVSASATTTTIAGGTSAVTCPYSSITYGLVSGSLTEDRTNYNSLCQVTSTTTGRVLLTKVVNKTDGTQPLFVFFDKYGNQLGSSSSASSYATAGSVQMNLYVQYQTGAPSVSLTDGAALRNNR